MLFLSNQNQSTVGNMEYGNITLNFIVWRMP